MKALKCCFSVFFFLCSLFLFCFSAYASENIDDAISYDELNIIADRAVLTGQTQQMRVEEYSGTGTTLLVWTSSNPSVISCTPTGKITGIKEGQATITVKATIGDGEDSITVYCAKRLSSPKTAKINRPFAFSFYIPRFYTMQTYHYNLAPLQIASKVDIKGTCGSYFYVEFVRNEKRFEGFMTQSCFNSNIASNEVFKQLSRTDLDAYVGINKDSYKVTTNYKGEVKWKVSNPDIINFDSTTGKVYCKKPGIATISATADGKTLTCTVHSIYVWPQNWTGAANRETCVYKAVGNTYIETSYTLSAGEKFTVKGDMGDSSGWAYGVDENGGWGYIPISHISTKNTVSFYNNLNWLWPVKTPTGKASATYITSPYGWRDTRPIQHKGIDITNGTSSNADLSNSIDGYEVVSAFAGTVIYVHDNSTNYQSCGNCVAVRSKDRDPVTGEYFVAIYMHLKSKPKVNRNQEISANTILGYVGNTGNSTASHLHFEANNQNLSYGEKTNYSDNPNKEMIFGCMINPLYFYMDYYYLPEGNPNRLIINWECEAMNYRKPFWYGDDIKESKYP